MSENNELKNTMRTTKNLLSITTTETILGWFYNVACDQVSLSVFWKNKWKKITGKGYCERILPEVYEFIRLDSGDTDVTLKFMHKNAPVHTTAVVKQYLETHCIQPMVLPPYSPDLNPIVNKWGLIKSYVQDHYGYSDQVRRQGRAKTPSIIQEAWRECPKPGILVKILSGMHDRCLAIIPLKSGCLDHKICNLNKYLQNFLNTHRIIVLRIWLDYCGLLGDENKGVDILLKNLSNWFRQSDYPLAVKPSILSVTFARIHLTYRISAWNHFPELLYVYITYGENPANLHVCNWNPYQPVSWIWFYKPEAILKRANYTITLVM